MKFINVGKIVNTFGIKGELKIVSCFEMPEKVFKKNNYLRINNIDYLITGCRYHHYNYLVELNGIKDINKIEYLVNSEVFFDEDALNLTDNEYLITELIDYEVYDSNKLIGIVTDYDNSKINPLIKVNDKFYIPLKANYIDRVNKLEKKIYGHDLEGLML